jgi:hypothetical protein
MAQQHAERIKDLVEQLKAKNGAEALEHAASTPRRASAGAQVSRLVRRGETALNSGSNVHTGSWRREFLDLDLGCPLLGLPHDSATQFCVFDGHEGLHRRFAGSRSPAFAAFRMAQPTMSS